MIFNASINESELFRNVSTCAVPFRCRGLLIKQCHSEVTFNNHNKLHFHNQGFWFAVCNKNVPRHITGVYMQTNDCFVLRETTAFYWNHTSGQSCRAATPWICRALDGISSLECPLFSHSYLPMNSDHSTVQIDWIAEVGGSSLWSFVFTSADRILTTDGTIRGGQFGWAWDSAVH